MEGFEVTHSFQRADSFKHNTTQVLGDIDDHKENILITDEAKLSTPPSSLKLYCMLSNKLDRFLMIFAIIILLKLISKLIGGYIMCLVLRKVVVDRIMASLLIC